MAVPSVSAVHGQAQLAGQVSDRSSRASTRLPDQPETEPLEKV